MEDIKEKVEKLIKKIQTDENFATKFKKEPVKAVEEVLGVDLPDEKINSIIDAVKAKLTVDDVSMAAKKIQSFFNKKN